ncbi:TIGR00180 family glycosyltransferase [Pseudomonas syringae]|nr:TIGR00180 family glycosyltransferase [Pseudomonas syringae]MBD8788950.1 TIGR00180 family glycosyltransferase [Pseudomonas syringae]MBD8800606.1 TIGR00180 family glycosyltransferase [Pseudomonas syringae]MBD8812524.1 TIGR00180 family glycosyltransferase [Pseudomonas syringae]
MPLQTVDTAVTPLSERFTLVVISHNRNAFLRRTMEYYRHFAGKLVVLDSSNEADTALVEDYPGIDYHHLGHLSYFGLQEKLAYGSSIVTTPYMAFAADDDFIVHDALEKCVDFLDANPDYGMCHGYGLMYLCRATEVQYFRRDIKGQEDYGSESAAQRVIDFMGHFLPPFYAVTRTRLLRDWHQSIPAGTSFEWQEIGHSFYLLACAKARILDIPYIVREINYGGSDHNTNVLTVLTFKDPKSVAEREAFAEFLTDLPTGLDALDSFQKKQIALLSFEAMADCLLNGKSLRGKRIFRSQWSAVTLDSVQSFDSQQFMDMPFYNKAFFDLLSHIEFLLHTMPAGRQQLIELEGVLVKQYEFLRQYPDDTHQTVRDRLWQAFNAYLFNPVVVRKLAHALEFSGGDQYPLERADVLSWERRLAISGLVDRKALLEVTTSGRLLSWLDERVPDDKQIAASSVLIKSPGPLVEILLLNLENDASALQATFDSLVACNFRSFKVVVLATEDSQTFTTRQDTVHFMKVDCLNYGERLNDVAGSSAADWLLLARAGDEFTASGLLRFALELRQAAGVRAVAMDEIHRQPEGTLRDIFRPGFNLDLLLGIPSLMAHHWLIHKDAWLEAGGYNSQFEKGLEFDLLLRIIEQGGMAGLAHLAEPLLICKAPVAEKNDQHAQILARHLEVRGYTAQVTSSESGTLQVDYRHAERPMVSIVLHSQDNFEALQLCLISVLQRTRYHRHEIVIADNSSQDLRLHEWLGQLESKGDRISVVRLQQATSHSALLNQASLEAKGEYLLFLAPQSQVITANWIEVLLNQAQRPEVGVVGAKLVDEKGACTQAGLILGFDQGIGVAMAGEGKDAAGYMQRLRVEQNCSAVSGACMMVRKELFDAVGGFDEVLFGEHLAAVDLCLKLDAAGYLTVWTPHAQILHDGVLPAAEREIEALRDRWPVPMQHDRAYNPNHLHAGKAFALGAPQPVEWDELLA